jgi:hypothetical protein
LCTIAVTGLLLLRVLIVTGTDLAARRAIAGSLMVGGHRLLHAARLQLQLMGLVVVVDAGWICKI